MGTSGPSDGTAIQANFSSVQSGTYFLDVAGTADGSSGGNYIGQLNLSSVPLPAAIWLLISGPGLFGAVARRTAEPPFHNLRSSISPARVASQTTSSRWLRPT